MVQSHRVRRRVAGQMVMTFALIVAASGLRAETRVTQFERIAPFEPSDRRFVADVGEGLDTGCRYDDFEFEIDISRWVGATDPDGLLLESDEAVTNGALTAFARLDLTSFDVDSEADCSASTRCRGPEVDRIWLNGHVVGELHGRSEEWSHNSFLVPIEYLKFARRESGRNIASKNVVRVEVDVLHPRLDVWCTSIDWGSLSFGAMSPIVLVHGNNSDGRFFERRGLVAELERRRLPFDDAIDLETASIRDNARELDGQIRASLVEFGVDSIHLVTHSKGGLDIREWMGRYFQGRDHAGFDVVSFTTLGTPHRGSLLADMVVKKHDAIEEGYRVRFLGEPRMSELLARLASSDPGTRDLTTDSVAAFNAHRAELPVGLVFNAIGADADRDGDGHVTVAAGEVAPMPAESPALVLLEATLGEWGLGFAVDRLYQLLLRVRTFDVILNIDADGSRVARLLAVSDGAPQGNDVLVTIRSALASGGIGRNLDSSRTYTGAEGRNHAGIGDAVVGRQVASWLHQIARRVGDMSSLPRNP